MQETGNSDQPRRDIKSRPENLPNARGNDPKPRRQSSPKQRQAGNRRKNRALREPRLIEKHPGLQNIFRRNDVRNGVSMRFLVKLVHILATLKRLLPDQPTFSKAIQLAVMSCFGGEYTQQVSDIATFIEWWMESGLEFKLQKR